jgi:Arc/MetJ family transcription regulator
MKRTTLMLDEELLEEAVRCSGERTYSRTVERALRELVRRARAGRILDLVGSGAWEGELSAMRGDSVVAESRGVYRTRKRRSPRDSG